MTAGNDLREPLLFVAGAKMGVTLEVSGISFPFFLGSKLSVFLELGVFISRFCAVVGLMTREIKQKIVMVTVVNWVLSLKRNVRQSSIVKCDCLPPHATRSTSQQSSTATSTRTKNQSNQQPRLQEMDFDGDYYCVTRPDRHGGYRCRIRCCPTPSRFFFK